MSSNKHPGNDGETLWHFTGHTGTVSCNTAEVEEVHLEIFGNPKVGSCLQRRSECKAEVKLS